MTEFKDKVGGILYTAGNIMAVLCLCIGLFGCFYMLIKYGEADYLGDFYLIDAGIFLLSGLMSAVLMLMVSGVGVLIIEVQAIKKQGASYSSQGNRVNNESFGIVNDFKLPRL